MNAHINTMLAAAIALAALLGCLGIGFHSGRWKIRVREGSLRGDKDLRRLRSRHEGKLAANVFFSGAVLVLACGALLVLSRAYPRLSLLGWAFLGLSAVAFVACVARFVR